MLIFLLQSVWLYISELAGKDLELEIIFRFLLNISPRLVVIVLPLTILLSSIMVFGSLSENYEFAAMKASGISLQRSMRVLIIFTVFLGFLTFLFSNYIIPVSEYNFRNLRKNIAKVKPTMAIAEGQFSQIGNYNIKVGIISKYFRLVFFMQAFALQSFSIKLYIVLVSESIFIPKDEVALA